MCWSLFLKNLYRPSGLQLHEKETPTQVFSCEYGKNFKNSFFYRIPPVFALEKISGIFDPLAI